MQEIISMKKKKLLLIINIVIQKLWLLIKVAVWKNRFNLFNLIGWVEFEQSHIYIGTKKKVEVR